METKMKDWQVAFLTHSGRYYCRNHDDWRIDYYNLRKEFIPLASAKCENCGDIIQSKKCWDFVSCKCGDTMVDTDRWMPERHRILTK